MVVVHDPDTIRHMPDLSHPMRALFRLPWERGEATPTGRAAKATGPNVDPTVEAPFVGLGLDLALLTSTAAGPRFPAGRAVLIGDRSGAETALLARSPYRDLPLECSPDRPARDKAGLARFKAEAATRWGCTHFIETDAEQAIAISGHAPHLIVTWWSAETGQGWTIGAAAQPAPER